MHISRLPGGARVVTQVTEVLRYDPEENQMILHDIFNFRNGVSLRATGYLPSFIDSLVDKELLDVEFLYGREAPGRRPSGRRPRQGSGSERVESRELIAARGWRNVASLAAHLSLRDKLRSL